MANYTKIKRIESAQSYITIAREENWVLKEWEDVKEVERGIKKLEKEVKRRIDKDNTLESKTAWDHYLSLQPIKRLESHLLFREEPWE